MCDAYMDPALDEIRTKIFLDKSIFTSDEEEYTARKIAQLVWTSFS